MELFRVPPLFDADDFFALAERVLDCDELLLLLEALLPEALRAEGRRVLDFFRLLVDPRFAELRFPPLFFALLRFDPLFFAPPFLRELLPPLRRAPPRDDLARVAMIRPREGGAGRNRNFRAQAEACQSRRVARNAETGCGSQNEGTKSEASRPSDRRGPSAARSVMATHPASAEGAADHCGAPAASDLSGTS